jgi:TRAP transporter 4TM/12TM fusion protein
MGFPGEKQIRSLVNNYAIKLLSCAYVLFFLYYAYTGFLERARFSLFFLLFSLTASGLRFMLDSRSSFFKVIRGKSLVITSVVLIVFSISATLYLMINFNYLSWSVGANTTIDFIFAFLLLIPILLMSWKRGGSSLIILILIALFYMIFGRLLPGARAHGGFDLKELLVVQVLSLADSGLLGAATQVVATWVAIFIVYAGIIQGFGAFDSILKGTFVISRNRINLAPQLPVISSLFFGSISGAASANVGATGSFSIPLMKRYGLPPKLAGAIEAVASTGGQVMPPIMGSTAFLMASLLGVSYVEVMLHGFVPAFLFYVIFAFGVYEAAKSYLGLPTSNPTKQGTDISQEAYRFTKQDMLKLIPLSISVVVILVCLIYLRFQILQAALYGILSFLIAQMVYEASTLRRLNFLLDFGKKFLSGVTIGSLTAADIGVMVAGMALILKALTATALAPKISYMMVDLSGDSLIVLLVLTWIVSFLFGMAVSTLIVYLLVAVLAVPAMEALGVPKMISHFLIFYFAAIAMITPPTAPASLVAAGIAGESFMKTAFEAVRVGIPLLLLPFAFVTYPELILVNSQTWYGFLLITVAFMGISHCLNSRKKHWKDIFVRALSFLLGLFISFHPFFWTKDKTLSGLMALAILLLVGRSVIGQSLGLGSTSTTRHKRKQ